jgi:hypothetical protein
MNHPPLFMSQPFPRTIRQLFLDLGATFDFSMEDRRNCGLGLERHFIGHPENPFPHAWFMPVIFGGVEFNHAPPWAVMLAMGIYGHLAEGSPAPLSFQPNTLPLGYHALRIPPGVPLHLVQDGAHLPLTDAFLRIDQKVDPDIWIDLYGLAPLAAGVRMAPFTLISAEHLSGCIAGAILLDVERKAFLNPLKECFEDSDLERFFAEAPTPARLQSHRERLFDILRIPDQEARANLHVGIDLIRMAFAFP